MDDKGLNDFFRRLDRAFFLEDENKRFAEFDGPLPIGFGQTISQPSLVLYMTRMLDLRSDSSVLEIGTGSGYQTAFLAQFGKKVYTIERIQALSENAQRRLAFLGYNNIEYLVGDGSGGWRENAPYDRIMVTAAARHVPKALTEQLAPGGIMIIPAGEGSVQSLLRVEKTKGGQLVEKTLLQVRFVDLVGDY